MEIKPDREQPPAEVAKPAAPAQPVEEEEIIFSDNHSMDNYIIGKQIG